MSKLQELKDKGVGPELPAYSDMLLHATLSQILDLLKSIKKTGIENTAEIQVPALETLQIQELASQKDILKAILELKKSVQKIHIPDRIKADFPEFPDSMEVTKVQGIKFSEEITDLIEHLKFITDSPKHPISVRLSDGKKFIKALGDHGRIISMGGGGVGPHTIRDVDDVLGQYRINDVDDDASPNYYGFTDRDTNWFILKETKNTGADTYRYAKGASSYPTNWTSRTGLSYGYFNDVF